MTDSTLDGGRRWTDIRVDYDRWIAVTCFGAACTIGLVFALVGLETHSFWYDELFTVRLLEPIDGTTLLSRITTDVHPPLYLLTLAAFRDLFGGSDAALRSFSAIAACGAIAVFITATRTTFSLPARLFGAAIATGSTFWFFQAQNARSYALCLLISTGVMAFGLSLLRERRPWQMPAMLALMIAGSFVHFYVMYVCLAALIALGLFQRRDRSVLGAAAVFLLFAGGCYVKLVMEPHSQVSLWNNWYQNNPAWYASVLESSFYYVLGYRGFAALLLCCGVILYAHFTSARVLAPTTTTPVRKRWPRLDRATAFLIMVPVLVFVGAVVSSTLVAPNFSDRNFLVASPFIWGLAARSYDAAAEKATPLLRLALACSLAVIVLSMAWIATSRLPHGEVRAAYEPYRESATWIQSLPSCRGQLLPVVTTDDPAWYKPGYAAFIYESGYGRYLKGFAQPTLVFSRDLRRDGLPRDLILELQRRIDGEGCPVLAWSSHNMTLEAITLIEDRLLGALDRRDVAAKIGMESFYDGYAGYVLYVRR